MNIFYRMLLAMILFMIISCGSKDLKNTGLNIDVDADIYIVPIGDVEERYLTHLIPKLEERFTTKVYLALDKRMQIPDYAYDEDANQYVAMYILTEMSKKLTFPGNYKVLGVCNVDLFLPESNYPFIFGQAIRGGNVALISMIRMNPNSYVGGKPNDELLFKRMQKEAIHELGHTFGLDNTYDPECVMYLPKDLKELDKKTDSFTLPAQQEFIEMTKKKKK